MGKESKGRKLMMVWRGVWGGVLDLRLSKWAIEVAWQGIMGMEGNNWESD
jgi:hypothetical protein